MDISQFDELKNIEFNHKEKIQKRFNDVDIYGHVNNAVQLTYFDYGKITYMEKVGFKFPEDNGDFLVTVHVGVDFVSQVFFQEDTEVWTKIFHIGHKSLKMIQVLVDAKTRDVKTISQTVMCGFNMQRQESIEVKDTWRELINQFEQFHP